MSTCWPAACARAVCLSRRCVGVEVAHAANNAEIMRVRFRERMGHLMEQDIKSLSVAYGMWTSKLLYSHTVCCSTWAAPSAMPVILCADGLNPQLPAWNHPGVGTWSTSRGRVNLVINRVPLEIV